MKPIPDPEGDTRWVLALYGATMVAVQTLENTVSWVYLLADAAKRGGSSGTPTRQWMIAFRRSWAAFQQGTAPMKLNDAKRGLQNELDPDLYAELDSFFARPRAQLAHRFLIERLSVSAHDEQATPDDLLARVRFRPGTVHELLQVTLHANALTERLFGRGREILASLPEAPDAPNEVRQFAEEVARMAMFKQFPEPLDRPRGPREHSHLGTARGP